jgi:hypothetical protein
MLPPRHVGRPELVFLVVAARQPDESSNPHPRSYRASAREGPWQAELPFSTPFLSVAALGSDDCLPQ